MSYKFKIPGFAETIIAEAQCPDCNNHVEDITTSTNSKVTYEGIVVVCDCKFCGNIFIPFEQKRGIISSSKLKAAIDEDSKIFDKLKYQSVSEVELEVEKINWLRQNHWI